MTLSFRPVRHLMAAVAVASVVAATGCEMATPRGDFPELTYAHLAPIRLDVSRIEIVSTYAPPMHSPNVEHLFPISPAAAVERWGKDRLRAAGPKGLARLIVKRADVVEIPLEKSKGVRGLLTTDQAERYEATLDVEIEIRDERGFQDALVAASAKRSSTLKEGASALDRDRLWFRMTEALMTDINVELEAGIARHFSSRVVR